VLGEQADRNIPGVETPGYTKQSPSGTEHEWSATMGRFRSPGRTSLCIARRFNAVCSVPSMRYRAPTPPRTTPSSRRRRL
jgi:hypothetical protein